MYYYFKDRPITKSQKLAWLAGFIDGEGSFMLIRVKGNGKSNPYVWPVVSIPSTDRWVLEYIQDLLTEVINRKVISELKPRNNLKPNQKPVYILRLNKIQDIYHLIRVLKSFLVLKKERGDRKS